MRIRAHLTQPSRAFRAARGKFGVAQHGGQARAVFDRHQHQRLHAGIHRLAVVLGRPVQKPARQTVAALRRDVLQHIREHGVEIRLLFSQIGPVTGVAVPVMLTADPPQRVGGHGVHPGVGRRGLPHVIQRIG